MATSFNTGWMAPGTVSTEGSSVVFSNINNVKVEDGVYSTASLPSGVSSTLFARNFNPGIPSNATITGMEIRLKGLASGTDTQFYGWPTISATSESAAISNPAPNNYFIGVLTSSNTFYTAGASTGWSTNFWGGYVDSNTGEPAPDPTIAQINSTNFGFFVGFLNLAGTASNVSVDTMQLKIYYEIGGVADTPKPVLFWAFP